MLIKAFNNSFFVKSHIIGIRTDEAKRLISLQVGDRMVFPYKSYERYKFYATVADVHEEKYGILFKVKTDIVKSEIKWPIAYVWISTDCLGYFVRDPCSHQSGHPYPQSGILTAHTYNP
jgi:hypothetical protein